MKDLLLSWKRNVAVARKAHYESATYWERWNYKLGIPVIVLTTLVGTSVFSTLKTNPGLYITLTVGVVSVVAAILAAIHTFLRFSERSEKHRNYAVRFSALETQIEHVLTFPLKDEQEMRKWTELFAERWDAIRQDAPTVPKRIWAQTLKEIKRTSQETLNNVIQPTPAALRSAGSADD